MALTINALLCAGLAVLLWTCVGLAFAARIAPRPLAFAIAPAIGWAVHSALALPLFRILGMSPMTVTAVFAVSIVAALVALWTGPRAAPNEPRAFTRTSILAFAAAAILALGVMAAILPKVSAEGVALAAPIFDHSKVAMIEQMMRLGVPPENPFFGAIGAPTRLSYYYLWHFSAAELAVVAGVTGWEADAGLTWFTAFASLAVMIGFAIWLSGRAAAALWVVILAATASIRPILYWLFSVESAEQFVGYQSGLGGWLFQTSWAPQHMAGAVCAVLAIFLLVRLAERPSLLIALVFALTMVAGFECSTWVGGVAYPLAAAPIALVLLLRIERSRRWNFAFCVGGAALLAILIASPLLYDQFRTTAMRGDGSPITIEPYEVLADGGFANLPAYWLIFLVVEFPAIYLTGVVSIFYLLRERALGNDRHQVVVAFAMLTTVSLVATWLLVSTLGDNNDLGWRAALPAVMALIVFAAIGLARVTARPLSLAGIVAIALVLLGVPDGAMLLYGNAVVAPTPSSKIFAATPAMWAAVRRHSAADDRIANNPQFLHDVTPWAVNISWALLANRPSCYAGAALVGPFAALSKQRQDEVETQFTRVFDGQAAPGDVAQLATQYNCALAVVTAQDGAWSKDPFAASPLYRLVEESPAGWRIYKRSN